MSNISASYSGVLLVLSCVDVNTGTASVELMLTIEISTILDLVNDPHDDSMCW